MLFIVATNVIASQLPERQPTGKPTARAIAKADTKCFWNICLAVMSGRPTDIKSCPWGSL